MRIVKKGLSKSLALFLLPTMLITYLPTQAFAGTLATGSSPSTTNAPLMANASSTTNVSSPTNASPTANLSTSATSSATATPAATTPSTKIVSASSTILSTTTAPATTTAPSSSTTPATTAPTSTTTSPAATTPTTTPTVKVPTMADINQSLTYWANQYNIPPVVLKAIAWQESGWRQFKDSTGTSPLMGYDGIGIGVMQVSDYNANDPSQAAYIQKLKTDYDFNIEEGARILDQKWRMAPKIGNGDRNILENWYFAVLAYNSWNNRNNPNYAKSNGSVAYQNDIFALMGQNYNPPYTSFTSSVTLPDPSLLPEAPMDQPFASQSWAPSLHSTWTPWYTQATEHRGDLTINAANLLSTGGTPSTETGVLAQEPANGDYWANYGNSTSIYALGFYMTGYDATSGSEQAQFAAKIVSAAQKAVKYANDCLNSGYLQTARQYFFAVLALPKLDANVWQQAQNGYNQAIEQSMKRLGGPAREDTAITIANEGWPQGAGTVILVGAEAWPDALSSTPLAYKDNAPILLTPQDSLWPQVQAELQTLHAQKIIIIGGPGAVGQGVEDKLKSLYGATAVQRIWGQDRYETAAQVAAALGPSAGSGAFLVNGEDAPDALSAAPLAARLGEPILLTSNAQLPSSVVNYLNTNSVKDIHVIGDTALIPDSIVSSLKYDRIGGADRYQTMVQLLNKFHPPLNNFFFTNGSGDVFADALAGGPLVAKLGGALIFTDNQSMGSEAQDYINQVKAYATFTSSKTGGHFYELGGSGVINIDSALEALLHP